MAINIIGAGPTGVTIAWELSGMGHEVHVWEKHDTCGGSWWEPEDVRDMHAPRVLFKRAYINFRNILKEMGLKWDDYFTKSDSVEKSLDAVIKYFSFKEYLKILKLIIKSKSDPEWAKSTTLYEFFNGSANPLIEVLPMVIDGVTWDRMTIWEFVDSIDTTLMSTPYTQNGSGRKMGKDMELALKSRSVIFHFNEELMDINYKDDSYMATFRSGKTISDDTMILAIDPGPAKLFVKDNWGPDAKITLDEITYGSVNVLLFYEDPPIIETDVGVLAENGGKIFPVWIEQNILSCSIFRPCGIPPERLVSWVCRMIGAPLPDDQKICWGSKWNGSIWEYEQTGGIYTPNPIPVWGKCPHVAMVGMMSPREISFASIEAAVEVGRRFVKDNYDGQGAVYSTTASTFIIMLFIIIFFMTIF